MATETHQLDLPTSPMTINMGPSHPAMHGTVRMVLQVDGEVVKAVDVQPGFLHRGFEKECERATWTQVFPYTDRLNYVSPMLNNIGYAMAVEKLLGIRPPERAEYIRVVVGEIARVADHITCIAAGAMELGGFTPFLWFVKARDLLWDLLEEVSGARLTHSYVRIGGVGRDLPTGFAGRANDALAKVHETVGECDTLLTRNRIFMDRMQGVGTISAEDAISYGFTGPCLRSTGRAYDVRKDHPYSVYDRLDFAVPVGSSGDNFDRYLVRFEELRQSMKLIAQALSQMPPGSIQVDDPRIAMPNKRDAYNTIEAMINHFKLIVDGIKVPPGEVYSYSEAANGELGFYLVSDGTGRPYKCRVRSPCFTMLQAIPQMVVGRLIADIVPTFGSINMIGGECDR